MLSTKRFSKAMHGDDWALVKNKTLIAVRSWVHQGRVAPALGFIKVRLRSRDLETHATTIPFQARAVMKRP